MVVYSHWLKPPRCNGSGFFYYISHMARPPHYKTPEELQMAIDAYLTSSPAPNMAGLAHALGFVSRVSIFDYEHRNEKFSSIIKKARLYIEADKLEKFTTGDYNTAAVIFTLTNNHGYQNTRNVDHTSKGESIIAKPPKVKKRKD